MIPILYRESEKEFVSNGIGQLTEATVAEVTEGRNGAFELYLEYPASGVWADEINEFKYIQVKPNDVDDEHAFRIYDVVKQLDPDTIEVYAISKASHDLVRNAIKKVEESNVTPEEAMLLLKSNSILDMEYDFVSDIEVKKSVHWEFKNPANCIMGEDGSLIELFGGELKKTNDTIYLYENRGRKYAAEIRQDKNLDGFKQTVSIKGLVTKILPYFSQRTDDGEVTIIGDVVTSDKADLYPVQFIEPVDFGRDDDITDKGSLDIKAANYFTTVNKGVDVPHIEIEVDLYQLVDSPEYYRFKDLERISLCDTVSVWVEMYDIDVDLQVRELKYDVLAEKVISLTAGSKSSTLNETYQKDYKKQVEDAVSSIKGESESIDTSTGNKNFRGSIEPTSGMKEGDNWYEPCGKGMRLHIYDGAEWVFIGELSV